MSAPEYPGYKAAVCNGCGLCCKTVACSVSLQFGLWRDGKCRALRFEAGRYWCDAIRNPRRVSVRLASYKKAAIIDAIGAVTGCDSRHATDLDGALKLLAESNLADDIHNSPEPTYPRAASWHKEDGTTWIVMIESPLEPPVIQQCIGGQPVGEPEILEPA